MFNTVEGCFAIVVFSACGIVVGCVMLILG